MIVGIGTDLVEISRIQKMISRHKTLNRIFTTNELSDANNNATTLAGNFAVKEAVSKVFGTGFFGVEANEIEVLRDHKGKPCVKLYGQAEKMAENLKIEKIHISITNTGKYTQAFAIGECL